jgi:uncharacterized protein
MAAARSKLCTECRKRFRYSSIAEHEWFPFCSERCKVIDLGRWLSDGYAIVEDTSMGHDLKAGGLNLDDIDDPDVREALRELQE